MEPEPSSTRPSATRDTAPDSAPVPQVVADKYQLGEELGRGGRGVVYRALQLDLDREVALKILGEAEDEDSRERFIREARITAEIHHPCIAEVFDAGVMADGRPYYAMELLEGETLDARIEAGGPLPPDEAVGIVAGIATALSSTHQKGFLHRDVKPSNIFLTRRADGGVDPKLIDFGIAKRFAVPADDARKITRRGLGGGGPKTVASVIVGTPRYLSPEQITGEPLDARSDVYALAATLYEALAGAPPFTNPSTAELLGKILMDDPPPLRSGALETKIPAALERAVLRGLAKAPADRYTTPGDFSAALWSALAEAQGKLAPSEPPAAAPSTVGRRAAIVALAALLLLGAFAFFRLRAAPPIPVSAPPPQPTASVAVAPSAAPTAIASVEVPPAPSASASAAPKGPRSPRAHASIERAPAPQPTTTAPAPPSSGFRIDDLKVPF